MSIRLSSALRTALVTNYGLGLLLQGGHIVLYAGAQPASADAAPTGTVLGTITKGGLAVPTPEAPAGGLLIQGGTEAGTLVLRDMWVARGIASGTFGWWRWVGLGSAPTGISTTAYRLDGAAGDSFDPAEITEITSALNVQISAFLLTLPAN